MSESDNQNTSPDFTSDLSSPRIEKKPKSRRAFLVLFGLILFFVFLIFKLPEAKIQNFVMAHIRIITQNQGLSFNAEKIKVSFFPFGPSVKIYNAEMKSLEDDKLHLKIEYLRLKPNLFQALFKNYSASITAELLDGEVSGSAGMSATSMSTDLEISNLNLTKATLLKKYTFVQLNGLINGILKLNIKTANLNDSTGDVNLSAQKLVLPAQTIFGINLPAISVSESQISGEISAGKLLFKNVVFGKNPQTDDLVATVTGDLALNQRVERISLNAKVVFSLSNRIIQSFPFIDSLLASAKGTDGKFTYKITGPITALEPKPGG